MRHLGLFLCGALTAATVVQAQTTPLIIDQNRSDRNPPAAMASAPLMGAPSAPATARMVTPFLLREVQVQGTSIDARLIEAATKPFIGQTVDAAAIQHITDALAEAYGKSTIGLYSIVAPDQDFAGGVLKVTVTEGYIERVDIMGDAKDHSLLRRYAARLTAERPLRRATLQRYVSLIRDIPGLVPDIRLQAGDVPGAMRLVVTPTGKRVMIGAGVNDTGSKLLGRTQFGADVTFYSLLREGEQTRFSFLAPTDIDRFRYFAFSQTEPLGADGTQLQFNAGILKTHPKGTNVRGEADSLQLVLGHPIIRSYEENLSVTGSIDGLNSDNAVIGQSIASERVRALRAAATYSLSRPKNLFVLSGIVSLGLDGLGAREIDRRVAVSDFFKLNGQAGFNQELLKTVVLRLRAAGQYGADRLPLSELFALGGADFGRAFAAASIVGDSGAAGSAELAYRPDGLGRFQGSEVYGFADRERTWYRGRFSPARTFDLASAGLGTRIAVASKVSLQLEAARSLEAPVFVAHPGAWRFNFAIRAIY